MDTLKEFLESLSQRIKSPIFGSVLVSFFIINWRAIAILLFDDRGLIERMDLFDGMTSWMTLLLSPFVLGLFLALVAPWVAYLGAYWAEKPTNLRRIREVKAASEVARIKAQLGEELNREVDTLIASAKQDAEVAQIEDKDLREDLQRQIDELRKSTLSLGPTYNSETMESAAISASNSTAIDIRTLVDLLKEQASRLYETNDYTAAEEKYQEAEMLLKNHLKISDQT